MMSITEWTQLVTVLFATVGFLVTAGWISAWWFSKKFSEVRHLIDVKIEKLEHNILGKVEYHEKNDDERFSQMRNDIWQLRLEAAAKEGRIHVATRSIPDPTS